MDKRYEDMPQVYLASSSPRRKTLLAQIGVTFQILPVAIHEKPNLEELPSNFALRMALTKAYEGWEHEERILCIPVIAADTIVVIDNEILGKPMDHEHGVEMLSRLSGRTHTVISAVACVYDDEEISRVVESKVTFREISRREIESYWASGEPIDKAGSYAIQGLGGVFVKHIEGSYSGIVGLPLMETDELLAAFNILRPLQALT